MLNELFFLSFSFRSDPKPELKDKSVDSSIGQESSLRSNSSVVLPTSDYYSPSSSESFSPSTSTPKAKSRTVASLVEEFDNLANSNNSLMRNRRVQTMYATVCTGEETGNLKGSKFEIIQKDIGYSSDADTSDANCDAISNGFVGSTASSASSISEVSSGGFNSKTGTCQSPDTQYKKRQVKRRFRSKLTTSTSCGALTSCTSKQRPWSFHAASEWTDWDYYQPPSFIPSTPTPTEPVVSPVAVVVAAAAATATATATVTPTTTPSTRSVATSTTLYTSENNEKEENKETSYVLIVTLSLFSLLLSAFFASNRSAHLELLYPTSSPPI